MRRKKAQSTDNYSCGLLGKNAWNRRFRTTLTIHVFDFAVAERGIFEPMTRPSAVRDAMWGTNARAGAPQAAQKNLKNLLSGLS
jgi:hypothetical protein